MQELAAVAEAAEARLLVVFADVGGEVGDGDGADVGGGFDGADGLGGRVGVFLDERLVAGCAVVGALTTGGRGDAGGAGELTVREGGRGGGGFVEPVGLLGCVVGGGNGGGEVGGDAGRGEVGGGGFGGGGRGGGHASSLFASFDAVTGGFVFGGGIVCGGGVFWWRGGGAFTEFGFLGAADFEEGLWSLLLYCFFYYCWRYCRRYYDGFGSLHGADGRGLGGGIGYDDAGR